MDARQDDGFRDVIAKEFNELWVVNLKGNARTSGERRRQEGSNVFDDKIRVGVAVYFLVRRQGAEGCRIFYDEIDDYVKSPDKINYIKRANLNEPDFRQITPDAKNNWLNQSTSNFESLIPLADRQTKLAKSVDEEQAIFGLYSNGVKTHRDEWVYDLKRGDLATKIRYFVDEYEQRRRQLAGQTFDARQLGSTIGWDRELRKYLERNISVRYIQDCVVDSLYRPFLRKYLYFVRELNGMQYQMPQFFPSGQAGLNMVICFPAPSSRAPFVVLATDKVSDLNFFFDGTQCLPLYRYTERGERVSNITQWGIDHINGHYRQEWGDDFESLTGQHGITAEEIFAYTYAVLHNPAYRHEYAVDLLREFPRLPLYPDFHHWAEMGQKLLDLHIGFESAEPFPLERHDRKDVDPKRAILRADKSGGTITLDDRTTLSGVPERAWEYRLGSRSALEWVLDQYKERKPRDPTIREKFNTYLFSDHKEKVIDLLGRVCRVSLETMEIVDSMAHWGGELVVYGDRDKHQRS